MTPLAVGIDVSTKRIAFAALSDEVRRTHVIDLPQGERGARRLHVARPLIETVARRRFRDATVFAIEIPWAVRPSFPLMGMAAVTMEAVQSAHPYAVVLDVTTGEWKLESVGFGNASKHHALDHARALGYDGTDQDVADAVCIAQCARERWLAQVGSAAA